jgi:hypothetical protein
MVMSLSRAVDTSECARYAIKDVEGISSDTRIDSGSGVMRRYDISSCHDTHKREGHTVARKIALNAGELPPSPFRHASSSSAVSGPSDTASDTSPKVPVLLSTDPTLPFLGLVDLGLEALLHTHRPDVHDDLFPWFRLPVSIGGGSADLTLYRELPAAGDEDMAGTVLVDGVGDRALRVDGAGDMDLTEAASRIEEEALSAYSDDTSGAREVDKASVKPSCIDI